MAVYKVIQDIEAEDKLLGPLTLKGLIYAGIAAILGFLNFKLLVAGIPAFIKLPVVIVFALPMALFAVLASPLGRDQPTEVWLLARIKYMLKPRERVWNQSGLSHLVTITVPKKIDEMLTKGYSQLEVQSRLKALATTLDSRGWVVKNVNVNLNNTPDYLTAVESSSDRLVAASSVAAEQPVLDIHASDDMLDEQNNPTAQKFGSMMAEAEARRKTELAKKLDETRAAALAGGPGAILPQTKEKTLLQQPAAEQKTAQIEPAPEPLAVMGTTIIAPGKVISVNHDQNEATQTTTDEQILLDRIHQQQRVFKELSEHRPAITTVHGEKVIIPPESMTTGAQTDKLELAQSGNDFSVSTLSALANRGSA